MALPLHACSICPKPSVKFCFACDRHLCDEHAAEGSHTCPTEGDDYIEAYEKVSEQNFSRQLAIIDKNGITSNALKIAESTSVALENCHLDIPISRDEAMMGGKHLHLPLTFESGDKWLVRLALQVGHASPRDLAIQEMKSEVATLTALESADVRIAKAKGRCIVPEYPESPYFFIGYLDGKASFMDAELEQQKAWVKEIAKDFVKLERLSFETIGSLTFESEDGHGLRVGPLVEPSLCGRDEQGRLSQLGPFEHAQDFRIAQVHQVLTRIEGGFMYRDDPIDAYLIHLEVIELIELLYPKQPGPPKFYIKHADDKGDHWLFRGDTFLGTIDWEWAYTTTKEEAFAAPLAFIDVGAFYDGDNSLSEPEKVFASAFDLLERPDLAQLVRSGKKYQRLPFVIGTDFSDLPTLFLAFRQLVLGQESKPTFEEWKEGARQRYKDHAFVQSKPW